MSSGSLGHFPGVDFLPADEHAAVAMQVPSRVPTLHVLGAEEVGLVQHYHLINKLS